MISREDDRDAEQQPDQTSRRESLVEMLLRPLGNDFELRHVFKGDLEERLSHSIARPEKRELTAEGAAEWLGEVQKDSGDEAAGSQRTVWQRPLAVLATLLTFATVALELYHCLPFALLFPKFPQILREMGERQLYKVPLRRVNPWPVAGLRLAAEQEWQAHPEDPVRYCYYVMTLRKFGQRLPDDYEQTRKRLEPDNAFWPLFQAGVELHDRWAFAPAPGGRVGVVLSPPPPDPLDEIGKLLAEAAAMPHCHSYFEEALRFAESRRQPIRTYAQSIAARDWLSGRELAKVNRSLLGEVQWEIEGSEGITISSPAEPAADPLAWQHKLAAWVDAIQAEVLPLPYPERLVVYDLRDRAGFVVGMRGITILVVSLFLTLAAVLALRQRPLKSAPARMARCTWPLLRPAGLAPLVWCGAVIPVGLLGIAAFSLQRDRSLAGLAFSPVALVLPVLAVTVEIARREVSGRMAFLGLRSTAFQRKMGWLMVALSLVPVVILVVAVVDGSPSQAREEFLQIAAGCSGGMVALWLAGKFLLGYASPAANVRHRLIALRLIPALLATVVALDVLALSLCLVERHLVALAVERGLTDISEN